MASRRADRAFCYAALPTVSRTFALCIRLLPAAVEHPTLIAYLLCRIADTIEDAPHLRGPEKERLLAQLGAALEEDGSCADAVRVTFAPGETDEARLAAHVETVLREFRRLPDPQRRSIRPWVQEMCAGMAEFARLDPEAKPRRLMALATVEDLDRYCYFVAGTVGHLLTDLFRVTRPGCFAHDRYHQLKRLATSFGLGLQLTNIIKDVADDRARGWSFVPRELCQLAGIRPEDLHDPDREGESRQVMNALIEKARRHLYDALDYCTALPRHEYRVRMFCLTSLYFAVRTLRLAAGDPELLSPTHKVKISRGAVYRTVGVAALCAPINPLVRAYFHQLERGGSPPQDASLARA